MDLGLAGCKAIVCASSRGLGRTCAVHRAHEGASVVINGRDRAALEATREEIAGNGAEVAALAADVNTREGQAALLAACPEPAILINTMARRRAGIFASSTARPYSRRWFRT